MKVLLINGSAALEGTEKGKLNDSLHDVAKKTFTELGFDVLETIIKNGYNYQEEVDKYFAADVIIYQFPIWWFGQPWTLKKYIDEIYSSKPNFYKSGWRTGTERDAVLYGTTGVLENKKFMVNTTQAAIKEVFDNPDSFMEGKSMDDMLFPIYKQNNYIGIKDRLPGYHCYNVYFYEDINVLLDGYKQHLLKIFKK